MEASFFDAYFEAGVFGTSPFESLDLVGVGQLVERGVELGRKGNPNIHTGVCGEHGGDPRSIHFFDRVGLDYVPVARLEAGRAVVSTEDLGTA